MTRENTQRHNAIQSLRKTIFKIMQDIFFEVFVAKKEKEVG
ncbi:MAG: hypothetical protein OEV79_07570 [candidate division WOR-3 bacterium]|nr:hypothetical protein [candidate division WOR-3 bacterium]